VFTAIQEPRGDARLFTLGAFCQWPAAPIGRWDFFNTTGRDVTFANDPTGHCRNLAQLEKDLLKVKTLLVISVYFESCYRH